MLVSKRIPVLVSLVVMYSMLPIAAFAESTVPPQPALPHQIGISEIKVTGDEYVFIDNNSDDDIADLGVYSLKSFNKPDTSATGVTMGTQALPHTVLRRGQRLLLSSTVRATCRAEVAGKLALSLTDAGGALQILDSSLSAFVVDQVSWSSSSAGDIQSVPSSTKDPLAVYYRYASGEAFKWQMADQTANDVCQLTVKMVTGSNALISLVNVLQNSTADSAPATILNEDDSDGSDKGDHQIYDGLLVPEITELLPNPAGSGNDATDEFIELYNPNNAAFDLSGFSLRSGLTTVHEYKFSEGEILPPTSFKAYYSSKTSLALSNGGGRVSLLDPNGIPLASTEPYGNAKDGQSWALANGHWYWSLTPTAAAPNIIKLAMTSSKNKPVYSKSTTSIQPKTGATTGKQSKTAKVAAAAKPPKKPKAAKIKKPKSAKAKSINATPTASEINSRPIHSSVVALVAGLALLYGAYEYRADLANGIYKLRRKFSFGRKNRGPLAGRRDD